MDRFDNFTGAEFRSLEIMSPVEIKVVLATQDKSRDFDWITVTLLFSTVEDAKLVEEKQLPFLDTSEGLGISFDNNRFAFCVGKCYNSASQQSAPLYIVAQSLKYEEGTF